MAQIEDASLAAMVLCVFAAGAAAAALSAVALPRWSYRSSPFTLIATLPAAISPAFTRSLLPAEDPYTGDGSPLAVLINFVFFAFLGLALAAPGLIQLYCRVLRPHVGDSKAGADQSAPQAWAGASPVRSLDS